MHAKKAYTKLHRPRSHCLPWYIYLMVNNVSKYVLQITSTDSIFRFNFSVGALMVKWSALWTFSGVVVFWTTPSQIHCQIPKVEESLSAHPHPPQPLEDQKLLSRACLAMTTQGYQSFGENQGKLHTESDIIGVSICRVRKDIKVLEFRGLSWRDLEN